MAEHERTARLDVYDRLLTWELDEAHVEHLIEAAREGRRVRFVLDADRIILDSESEVPRG